ncbi:MAG: biotin/lipoyl-containing protein, partial [Burkholderiaceae bacterium]
MAAIELKVPDIGDFKDVEIIEVLVKAGDEIVVEQSLITVESDKASMEIPASIAGRIVEMRVKLGDKISEGSVLAMIEPALASAASAPAPAPAAPAAVAPAAVAPATPSSASISPTPSPESAASAAPRRYGGRVDIVCETLVLGAGPGGYSAAFRAADLGL